MFRSTAARAALLALALACVTSTSTASAGTLTQQPSPAEARSFATTNGGWTSAVDYNGLACSPGVTCPPATPSYQATNGAGGAGDGHLRSSFGTRLGVSSTTTIAWSSPTFVAPSATTSAILRVKVRPLTETLLTAGSLKLAVSLVDVADGTRTSTLPDVPLPSPAGSFQPFSIPVPSSAVVAGRSYKLRIAVTDSSLGSVVASGHVDLDDVVLTLTDDMPPGDLTASFATLGYPRIEGSVDPEGLDTEVTLEYGPTTAYGVTGTSTQIDGAESGSQPFSLFMNELTPGETYHYRVTAENADGLVRTPDATFVAPYPPSDAPPTISGADNTLFRTVTFDRAADVSLALVEVSGDGYRGASIPVWNGESSLVLDLQDLGITTDGTYNVRIYRANTADLGSRSASVPLVLDRVAPDVSRLGLSVTPAASPDPQRTLSFVRPADAAVVTAQVFGPNFLPVGPPLTVVGNTAPITLDAADGNYYVRLTLSDAAGNSSTATSAYLTLDTVAPDAGPAPTVTGAANSRSRTVTFTRDPSTAAATIELLDDDVVIDTVPVVTDATGTLTLPDADGVYAVRVKQADAAGNSATTPGTAISLDRVAPDLSSLDLVVTPTLSGDRDRAASFARPADAEVVTARVIDADDDAVGAPITVAGATTDVTLGAADGEYRVVLTAEDEAGNAASRTSSVVVLDTTAPDPGPAPTVTGAGNDRTRTVSFTRDPSATAVAIELLDDHDAVVDTFPVAGGASRTISLPNVDGNYRVRVKQTDDAGNSATTPSMSLVLDRTGPDAGPAPTGSGGPDALVVRFARAPDTVSATVEVRDAAGTLVLSVPVPTGESATVRLPAAAGRYTVRVVQVDAAGNRSATPGLNVERAADPPPIVDPPAPPTPPTVDPPKSPVVDPPQTPGPEAPKRCATPALVLTKATLRNGGAQISGWTASGAGATIQILDQKKKQVGTATSGPDGAFSTVVPVPRSKAQRRKLGYRAVVDGKPSQVALLDPANALQAVSRTGTTVTLRGRVDPKRVGGLKAVDAIGGTGDCPGTTTGFTPLGKPIVNRRTGAYTLRVKAPEAGRLVVAARVKGTRASQLSTYLVR